MNERILDQELVGKACVRIAQAMIDYSNTGPDDMGEVSEYLTKAMNAMSSKLTPKNQDNFAKWLMKKAVEVRYNIGA